MNKKELINQSIDYIIHHLNDHNTIKDIANNFHFSEFYFSRIFKEVTGQSVYAFIKRLKMDQSAIDIKLAREKSITEIGLDYGYSASNYSSAFRKHHHISPAKFRKMANVTSISNPFHPEKLDCFQSYEEYNSRIEINTLEDFCVVYERSIGCYHELKEKWAKLMENYTDLINQETLIIERFYDDPVITALNYCICDLCFTVEEGCKLENVTTIKGGKFAVYGFEGKIEDIFGSIQGIFSIWLPKSNYEMDEKYGLNIYKSIDNDSVSMDLCIPIK